jgi:hypothetical protein
MDDQKVKDLLSQRPCALCSGEVEAIIQFQPTDPSAFKCAPTDFITIGLCKKCLDTFNMEYVETMLAHCGIKKEVPADEAATG